jgi:AraC family transcriptional regulator, transcriptional activator of the genes for pyochelin and ferripyochelin receptors
MNKIKTLSFPNIKALATPVAATSSSDNQHFKVHRYDFGQIEATLLQSGSVSAVEYRADLHEDLCIQCDEEQMLHTMNICFSFQGAAGLHLKQSNVATELAAFQHHCIYAPESAYDFSIKKNSSGFHLAVDLDYYTGLLCEQNMHTAKIKERIQHRQMVLRGTGTASTAMKQALTDIFYNPLTGRLRAMLIEARVLELIALQLDQFIAERKTGTEKSDVDTFYALREFLQKNFAEDLSLKSLSRTFGINEFKLKKGFRELFHTTIFEYIHELKMMHARHLLLDQKMYVSEVASEIGYKNPNHFSTAFKRKFGVSPASLK